MSKNVPDKSFSAKALLGSFFIFGLVLWVAAKYWNEIVAALQTADLSWVLLGILSYSCNYLSRAYRLRMLTGLDVPYFPRFIKIAGVHGFYSYFFPFRSGDLTLPFLLRQHAALELSQGGRLLVRARMLDILCIGVYLTGATLITPSLLSYYEKFLFLLIGVCFVFLPYVSINFLRRNWGGRISYWLSRSAGKELYRYPGANEIAVSMLIWFWTGCTLFCVIRSLQIPLSFFDIWFVTAVQLPLQLLPVQGFANAGSHEVSWLIALGMLGVQVKDGLGMALSSHVLIIFYVVILGGISELLPRGMSEDSGLNQL